MTWQLEKKKYTQFLTKPQVNYTNDWKIGNIKNFLNFNNIFFMIFSGLEIYPF
jgi:hypothetical protein